MELILGLGILGILFMVCCIWVFPILVIAFSKKTTGSEKLAWILAVIFISWFAWIFYILLAPIKRD
jgi:amino acid transporter